MKSNTDRSFIGLPGLKAAHHHQIEEFSAWAAAQHWQMFHSSHYDWWTFPIDQPSAYGFTYVVYEAEVSELNQDELFVKEYLLGHDLLAASWGWNLAAASPLPHPVSAQTWQNWPIRLYKAARSARLFGIDQVFSSWRTYALLLLSKGVSFQYNGRDLAEYFKEID